jgi:signal transduction histidine kinase/ligand-binding sensor domain-containing protein
VRAFIFIIAFIVSLRLTGQLQEIALRHFSTSDGLSDNNVRCIMVDSKGFIWLGTDDGLNRFDGAEFVTYRRHAGRKFSLSGNIVTDVKEDSDGSLWICTRDGGICQLNPKNGEVFHPLLISANGAEQTYVHCVYLNDRNEIVVGTDKGIFISRDKRNFRLVETSHLASCYDLDNFHNKIFAATNVISLSSVIGDSLVPVAYQNRPNMPFPAHSLNDLFVDKNLTLWAGAWDNYLHRYDPIAKKFVQINVLNVSEISYNEDEIIAIDEPSPGVLWLAMKSFAILNYDIQSGVTNPVRFSERESSKLNGRRIHFVFTDIEKRTWIGTDNGLHLYSPISSRFLDRELDDESTVTSFTKYENDLIATTMSGLIHIENEFAAIKKVSGNIGLKCYSSVADGRNLLVGTNSSILQVNPKNGAYSNWTEQRKVGFDVNSIASSQFITMKAVKINDKYYLLAIPFGHGVILGDLEKKRWTLLNLITQNGIENLIRNIYQDKKGRLWMLGSSYGLTRINSFYENDSSCSLTAEEILNQDKLTFNINGTSFYNGLQSKELTAIVEDEAGLFWITTQGAGLYYFDPNTENASFVSVESPLQSMQNMIADRNNNLWIVASGALLQYEIKNGIWRRYDNRDGIPTAGLSNAMYMDEVGRIHLGGHGFVLSFDPNLLSVGNEVPKPRLTHFTVMDQPMDTLLTGDVFELEHDKNFVSFSFTGLCFSDPRSVLYEYRLDGLDQDWRSNGNNSSVSYSDLSPGKYTFRLRAKSRKGMMSEEEAVVSFVILSPFYSTWWFVSIIAFMVALVLWTLWQYHRKQKEKLALVRNKIARDLHDDIGSALGSISFFSETAKRTLNDSNATNAHFILDKIGNTSRGMIENMHDIVWAVNPSNDSMEQMLDRMKSYVLDMGSSGGVNLHFNFEREVLNTKLSMTQRKNIFLFYKEAIYNSFKYSECQNIHVRMNKSIESKLHLIIEDDGIGFEQEKKVGTGNGLRNMKIRMDEIGARCTIDSRPSFGTRVEMWL